MNNSAICSPHSLVAIEMRKFVLSEEARVLCVRGKWGVGKTHAWEEVVKSTDYEKIGVWKEYSYVSLFGLSNINQIKSAITDRAKFIENTNINKDNKEKSFPDRISSFFRKENSKNSIDLIGKLVGVDNSSDLIDRFYFSQVKDKIICFDDLERSNENLDIREIMGLVNFLKEERNCKILLLYNDAEISEDHRNLLDSYLEKCADTVILFKTTPEYACSVAFSNLPPNLSSLKSLCEMLRVDNIRILKKIKSHAHDLTDGLGDKYSIYLENIMPILALSCCSFYKMKGIPPIHFIREYNYIDYLLFRNDKTSDDAVTRGYIDMLMNYPYKAIDSVSEIIIDGVENGYFDIQALQRQLDVNASLDRKSYGKTANYKVWQECYHNSLIIDDKTFLDKLFDATISEIDVLELHYVEATVHTLRKFQRGEEADKIIAAYVDSANLDPDLSFEEYVLPMTIDRETDPKLVEKLREKINSELVKTDKSNAILSALNKGTANRGELYALNQITSDEFQKAFETLMGNNVNDKINRILTIARSNSGQYKNIEINIIEALRRISEKSPITKFKIEKMFLT